jgi:hypothetical protein
MSWLLDFLRSLFMTGTNIKELLEIAKRIETKLDALATRDDTVAKEVHAIFLDLGLDLAGMVVTPKPPVTRP